MSSFSEMSIRPGALFGYIFGGGVNRKTNDSNSSNTKKSPTLIAIRQYFRNYHHVDHNLFSLTFGGTIPRLAHPFKAAASLRLLDPRLVPSRPKIPVTVIPLRLRHFCIAPRRTVVRAECRDVGKTTRELCAAADRGN